LHTLNILRQNLSRITSEFRQLITLFLVNLPDSC
jgi:hypothetical protein